MRRELRPIPASLAILQKIEEKHGLAFEEVEGMFRRPHLVLRGPLDQYGERRYSSFGRSGAGRYLVAVYTIPEPGVAKVITARDMTETERDYYRRNFRREGRS